MKKYSLRSEWGIMTSSPEGGSRQTRDEVGEDRRLWGGRFEGGLAPAMVPLNRSLGIDFRLAPYDLLGSMAWAGALGRAGVISPEEAETLIGGLGELRKRLESGALALHTDDDPPDEDIHSLVERELGEIVGAVAGKLHTGRSRNDQVATDFRLWGMEAIDAASEALGTAVEALVSLAERSLDVILPGYTHLQQGQPVRGAHWALAHAWPLVRDLERLNAVRREAAVLPLGSGAIAGCPFPVDREWLRTELGFEEVSSNSMDAVSDRDWAVSLTFTGALLGVHLSRLAEDLVLFTSQEFSFLRLGEGFSTGSSLMPQKRNPDVAELIRGKTGRLSGNLTALITLLKGLPGGYNRDLQEDKEAVFDTVDTLLLVLPALAGAVGGAEFLPDRIESRLDPALLATDLADVLVARGVPFRESHDVVGGVILAAERAGVPFTELSADALQRIHPLLDAAALDELTWESSVERRKAAGGTARAAVEAQLRAIEVRLEASAPRRRRKP